MIERQSSITGLVCNLSAIAPEQRAEHQSLAARLFRQAVKQTTELADGYAFRFPADRYAEIVTFMENERHCCPFFTFTLEVMADQGPLWLRITGPEGAKAILRDDLLG